MAQFKSLDKTASSDLEVTFKSSFICVMHHFNHVKFCENTKQPWTQQTHGNIKSAQHE